MMDSQFPQNFQDQNSYSLFQVPPQRNKEPMDLKNSIEAMIQPQNDFNQFINRAELEMSQLLDTMNDRNEKTLPNQFLTIPDISAILTRPKNHGALKILTKIQFYHNILNLTNTKLLTN